MPADLNNPFGPSCCDGGACSDDKLNALPCGCDPRIRYICHYHTAYADGWNDAMKQRDNDEGGR